MLGSLMMTSLWLMILAVGIRRAEEDPGQKIAALGPAPVQMTVTRNRRDDVQDLVLGRATGARGGLGHVTGKRGAETRRGRRRGNRRRRRKRYAYMRKNVRRKDCHQCDLATCLYVVPHFGLATYPGLYNKMICPIVLVLTARSIL